MSQELVADIVDWKVVGDSTNFTVIGLTNKGNVVYWKDGKWNEL